MLFLHMEKLSALLGAELGVLQYLWKSLGSPSYGKHQALWESLSTPSTFVN